MANIVEYVVLSSGGTNCLTLLEDGQAVPITALSRVALDLGDDDAGNNVTIDSDVDAGVFDWTTLGAQGKLILTLGAVLQTKLGKPGRYFASLLVSDPVNYDNLVWVDRNEMASDRLVFQVQLSPPY